MPNDFPIPVYNFFVSINGKEIGFQEVQGLGADIEYKEIKELANNNHTNRTFEKITYKNLILKKGVFKNGMTDMLEVASIFYENSEERARRNETVTPTTIIIRLLNEKKNPVLIWTLQNCVPVKYEFGALNAMESTVLIETMEFEYHSMKTELG